MITATEIHQIFFKHLKPESILPYIERRLETPEGRARLIEDITTQQQINQKRIKRDMELAQMSFDELIQEQDRLDVEWLHKVERINRIFNNG
mgnify:FL=1